MTRCDSLRLHCFLFQSSSIFTSLFLRLLILFLVTTDENKATGVAKNETLGAVMLKLIKDSTIGYAKHILPTTNNKTQVLYGAENIYIPATNNGAVKELAHLELHLGKYHSCFRCVLIFITGKNGGLTSQTLAAHVVLGSVVQIEGLAFKYYFVWKVCTCIFSHHFNSTCR